MPNKSTQKTEEVTTDKIVETLQNIIDNGLDWGGWLKGWTEQRYPYINAVTKKPYKGSNVLILSIMGMAYSDPRYLTWNQVINKGGTVRDSERKKWIPIVFYQTICTECRKPTTGKKQVCECGFEGVERWENAYGFYKYSRVYNVEQCENLDIEPIEVKEYKEFDVIADAQKIIDGYLGERNAPSLQWDGRGRAFYSHSTDSIHMPKGFVSAEEQCGTLFHEMAHSTGHESRLSRRDMNEFSHFGDEQYAKEELVAELSASTLCSYAGITQTFDNHVAYLRGWIKVLNDDKSLLLKASRQADKATKYIMGE
tara:strand:- start:188 stop:1120 length:933 start_codon:yes stop_codon:yes gene_type:complete